MCVSRSTSGEARCARSPKPVSVIAYTSWPRRRSSGTTMRFQDHAPPHAPCTITNVAIARSFPCWSTLLSYYDNETLVLLSGAKHPWWVLHLRTGDPSLRSAGQQGGSG